MANNLGKLALIGLGILAYKNRDRFGELVRPTDDPNNPRPAGASGGLLGDLAGSLGGAGGLGELLDRFRGAGRGDAVDSWIRQGPNEPIRSEHVEQAIDEETLESLQRQTGLSRQDILDRLAVNLPEVVDEMTPEGRLPDQQAGEASQPTLLDEVPPRRV